MNIINREFLPKKFLSVHASTITFYNDHLVYAWFEGDREGHPNTFIRIYNLHGDGGSILIGNSDGIPRWNPILFTKDKNIYLFLKSGIFCDRWQTQFYNITNWDKNISEKEILFGSSFLPAGLNACVKTKPIFVDDNMFCGSSVETYADWTSYIESYSLDSKGIKYRFRSNPICISDKKSFQHPYSGVTSFSQGVIQPAMWHDGKTMHSFFRSSFGLNKIFYSKSEFPYNEWETPIATDIPNSNSSIDVVYHNQRLFLVCNPVLTGRLPLSLIELDNEMKLIQTINITTELEGNLISKEASYPYLIEHDGKLHLTYTYGRSFIEHVVVDI